MIRYAVLCGSAPEGYRQKKLVDTHDFLTSSSGGTVPEANIVVFPDGVSELLLESALNGVFDAAAADDEADAGEVLLYICARTVADLHAELSDSACAGIEVVRLGRDEIRKDVIAYYAGLAEKLGVCFRAEYEADGELVGENALGYERVPALSACETKAFF